MVVVRTPVCELLGIEQPIVLAAMVAVPELAAAVSNAGGLGMVTLTWSTPAGDPVRETAALTDRPFCGILVDFPGMNLAGLRDCGCFSQNFCTFHVKGANGETPANQPQPFSHARQAQPPRAVRDPGSKPTPASTILSRMIEEAPENSMRACLAPLCLTMLLRAS